MRLFGTAYIGGWSACEHWGFTEQLFSDVVVYTTRRTRTRRQEVQGSRFILRLIPPDRVWGTEPVWRAQSRVTVSDPSRTVIDILNDPSIGGGIRQVAEVLDSYFTSERRDEDALIDYADRLGNRTVYKRLGYLVESLEIEARDLIEHCRRDLSAGYSRLDPAVKASGTLLRRWNLEVNVKVEASA